MAQIATTYIDHMGSDLSVVNAARVSFGKKSHWEFEALQEGLLEKDTKLIKYLAKHKHISPFGHVFASFHIKAPIFVARQLVKHKFLRWNEISRRYVDDEPEFYVPDTWRGRSADKKQGSEGVVDLQKYIDLLTSDMTKPNVQPKEEMIEENDLPDWSLNDSVYDTSDSVMHLYYSLLGAGVAPEQARMVLPQSTMTEWYWSGSLDAFADMCRLRCKEDTQYESRLVADQVSTIMQDLYPVSWAALMEG